MTKLDKKYQFAGSENKWQKYWQDNKIFKFDWNDTKRENIYSIDTPPPHVSGSLHMGHIFSYTQMDVIARFWRMYGKNVFYPFGFDDNGLPSERYVEKKLKIKSKSMERQEFVKVCDKEIREAELYMKSNAIEASYSFDFDEEYRTISPIARKVSQMSFLDLHEKNILERVEEPVIWDVVDQTALAQTEAEDSEVESQMNYLKFSSFSFSDMCDSEKKSFALKYGKIITDNYIKSICKDYKYIIDIDTDFEGFFIDFYDRTNSISDSPAKILSIFLYIGRDRTGDFLDHLHISFEDFFVKFVETKEKILRGLRIDSIKESAFKVASVELKDLEIMTTRPELLPACVAIFAHPDDMKKYQGKKVTTPLGVEVPVLFDESVEKEKGTGVMMCCTFGDNADVEKYKKYKLPLKMTINEKGCLYFDNVPEIDDKYKSRLNGLFTKKARAEILTILEEEDKIVKPAEKIIHTVKVGERSKSLLEIIVKKQWNVRVLDIKDELHKKASEVKWYPEWMEGRIHSWIDGLNWNWCISRQRFFGVPVPCWYSKRQGEEGKVILPKMEQLPIDPTVDLPEGYLRDEVIGENDVFDTWMTSSVSPQLSTQGFRSDYCVDKKRFETLDIPFDLRPQGHDIIRTWAFCTLVKSYYHENTIPWKNIFVNGFALSSDGRKMSKSAGNGVDPIKSMREFSSDAVRYWAANGSAGVDTNYSVDVIKNGQKLITKLFNSAKFAEMNFSNLNTEISTAKNDIKNGVIFEAIDKWLISRVYKTIGKVNELFKKYEYSKALESVENLFWNDFCDNYLEIAKVRCYGASGFKYKDLKLSNSEIENINKAQQSGIKTIYYTFNAILKMFAPFMPVITEEIYSCLYEDEFNKVKSISSRDNWSNVDDFVFDENIEKIAEVILTTIANVRKEKSEKNISIKEIIDFVEIKSDLNDKILKDEGLKEDLKNVCNAKEIKFV